MQQVLQIRMLGEFSIRCGETVVVSEQSRRSKSLQLLQYLLVRRGQPASQEDLMHLLLEDEDCGNPVNTLKNIVYRARKLFTDVGLTEDYIVAKNGAYGFNKAIDCQIDVEHFAALADQAAAAKPAASRCSIALQAIQAYGGDFLPREAATPWAVAAGIRYQNQYLDCVRWAFEQLLLEKDYEQVLAVVSDAITLYPYQEELRHMRMRCLYESGRVKEAMMEYNMVATLLLDELGVVPSESLRTLYQQILATTERRVMSFQDVLEDLHHDLGAVRGAYYCDYLIFSNLFQVLKRRMERNGESAYLLLVSLQSTSGGQLATGRCKSAIRAFHGATQHTLRRSDLYTRVTSSQFLVLLSNLTYENGLLVADRIGKAFKEASESYGARMHVEMVAADRQIWPSKRPDYSWS